MNERRERGKYIGFAFVTLLGALLVAAFVVLRSTAPRQKATDIKVKSDLPELQVLLPLDWYSEAQSNGLSIHLEEVKTIERKDDCFVVALGGTVTIAPSYETNAIELQVKVDTDGIGYYVSDIVSIYCNGHPEVHSEFDIVKRDCLAFMEKRLVKP